MAITSELLLTKSRQLGELLKAQNMTLTSAESCTGGLLASYITEIEGASSYFNQSWVTYSNFAKINQLGVDSLILEKYGAVSEEVANQMALGSLKNANANIAISITGIAGPGGGTMEKPVGTVCFGFGLSLGTTLDLPTNRSDLITVTTDRVLLSGNRENIRMAACNFAFDQAIKLILKNT